MPNIDAKKIIQTLLHVAAKVESNKDYLCELDGAVGDGDHGVSMTIGMRAVTRAMKNLPDSVLPADVFQSAADAYADGVGATIGPLYEAAFAAAAKAAQGKSNLNHVEDWALVYEAMAQSVKTLGQAELGDKTMLDSFFPAVEHIRNLASQNSSLNDALSSTGQVALAAAISTKDLVPKRGRAARLGDRAVGHQDAGATSLAIVLQGFAEGIASA
ncbi:MAG: dihydroxyacetone kinase subunit DhaL [Holophagaceae bacterium]